MARRKITARKNGGPRSVKDAVPAITERKEEKISPVTGKYLILGLAVVLLAALLWKNKGWVVPVTVNGQPVWRWEMEQRLVGEFGTRVTDELVSETLIRQAGAKNNVTASKADIDNKIAEIEKSLNGKITLKDALAQQGMTLDDFRRQVELQLILEKLTANQTTISDQEVRDYIDKNKTTLTASDEAGMKSEARKILLAQKQSTAMRDYFNNLRSQAKIVKYL